MRVNLSPPQVHENFNVDQRRTSSCSIVSELLLWLLDLGSSVVLSLFSLSDRSSVSIWYWEMTRI